MFEGKDETTGPPWYSGTMRALGSERSPSARVRPSTPISLHVFFSLSSCSCGWAWFFFAFTFHAFPGPCCGRLLCINDLPAFRESPEGFVLFSEKKATYLYGCSLIAGYIKGGY
ncbi:hypothetical protein E2C01_039864 [Portunus trituberculatus]|uniref:Uncharacterized protein n=1 Tax=Portunus trituberculatus TaxID=210409 RepID=A0A5B7FP67_PORTR|nr:hypothetical protein [Portunus trituberculatus]